MFYDLGSGSGRALVIARLLHDFDVCKGIEVLENLNGAAQIICKRFEVLASDVLDVPTVLIARTDANSAKSRAILTEENEWGNAIARGPWKYGANGKNRRLFTKKKKFNKQK